MEFSKVVVMVDLKVGEMVSRMAASKVHVKVSKKVHGEVYLMAAC